MAIRKSGNSQATFLAITKDIERGVIFMSFFFLSLSLLPWKLQKKKKNSSRNRISGTA